MQLAQLEPVFTPGSKSTGDSEKEGVYERELEMGLEAKKVVGTKISILYRLSPQC